MEPVFAKMLCYNVGFVGKLCSACLFYEIVQLASLIAQVKAMKFYDI